MEKINLINISYAKQALVENSREQLRMQDYAEELSQYHLIVFTRRGEGLPHQYSHKNLHVYGTNSRTKVGMLIKAYLIGRKILRNSEQSKWVISSQDPFETSLVGRRLLSPSSHHQVQLHGDFYGNPAWKRESLLNRLRSWYGIKVLKRADKIRVVSNRIKRSLVSAGVNESKITVLPIMVDLESFLAVGQGREVLSQKPSRFIFVGRLAAEKNVDLLVQAFVMARAQQSDLSLKIVGSGPEKTRLLNLIKNLKAESQIEIVEWTNNVPVEMSNADVLVLPSSHEGYGLVVLEAMAAGLPVIATDVGCVGEVMLDDHQGLVVEKNAASVSKAVLDYVKNPDKWRAHSQKAYEQAKQFASSQLDYQKQWTEALGE